jgi:response regulator of citrate/malate metabolism
MPDGLDIIIIDDDPSVAKFTSIAVKKFYAWGKVFVFTDIEEAIGYSLNRNIGVAIFIVDVFLNGASGFYFLDAVAKKFPTAHEDTIMITGNPSDDIVNMCVASNVNYLLEKPIKAYTLQLAVRAITEKYLDFAKKLMKDPLLAASVTRL